MHRRRFLQQASLAGVGFWIAGSSGRSVARSANDRMRFACIGVGGKGSSDTDQVANFGDLVAICDIDEKRLGVKAERFPGAKKYIDFRKLFDEMAKQVDAVVVSTPDHTHAVAAVMAMRLGKHVYCQKPLAHSAWEARLMRDTARQYKVATQMGNQGTASDGFRRGVEMIRAGVIGPVREVHVWTNRPFKYWKQAPDLVVRPTETPPVPAHVHWDLFLGPAPVRPYAPVYHPHDWRGWWDFGTGALGDMACHTANLPFMGLQLGLPTAVSAQSSEVNPETYPAWATITYEFPARGDQPPVKLTWYEGAKDGKRNLPAEELFLGKKPSDSGSLLIGDKGRLYSPDDYGLVQELLPEKNFESYRAPKPTFARMDPPRGMVKGNKDISGTIRDQNHKWEWTRAIEGHQPALSNFDYAATLTEAMLLGNVAVRVGKRLEYDAETQTCKNCPEAAAYIKPVFREGWKL
jgi:predicted dehydrogenase